jgi:glutathione S-transferase
MPGPLLVIGNKRYSSWSLRAWIALKSLGLEFREHRIALFQPESKRMLLRFSPAGRAPVLIDGELTVHDSMAIMEYANERYGAGKLLPESVEARARVRAVCAEMHAGFPELREHLPMNLGRKPARLATGVDTAQEIGRVLDMWERLREEHQALGPHLFGARSMADCMYLPVVTRFLHYGVDLGNHPHAAAYVEHMYALPDFQQWRRAAAAEQEVLPGMP